MFKKFKFTSVAEYTDRPSSIMGIKSNDKKFETNKYDIISNCYENKIPSGLTNEIVNGKILIKNFKK